MRFSAKTAWVTGGGSGIGRAAALRFASEGAAVVVVDISLDAAKQTCGMDDTRRCRALEMDVSDEEQVKQRFRGPVDILFNNAGIAVRKPVAEQDEEGWDRVMRINLRSVFLCSKYALPHMKRGAAIINMASVVGVTGVRNRAAYSTSKGAIVALTRNMAVDYAGAGIRVNCVCPGFTETPLTKGLLSNPDSSARLTSLHPLGRLGKPEDIAAAVTFLASDDAAWITGIVLPVDGGFTAGHGMDI